MKYQKQRGALARAFGVILAVSVVVSGVTFAALQSQDATLRGNTITSTSANLMIGDEGGVYSNTVAGYNFSDIEPGGDPAPADGRTIRLRNIGTGNLALRVSVNQHTFIGSIDARNDRTFIVITPISRPGPPQEFSLAALLSAYTSGTPLDLNSTIYSGEDAEYTMQVRMADDAVAATTSEAFMRNIDLVFNGVLATN